MTLQFCTELPLAPGASRQVSGKLIAGGETALMTFPEPVSVKASGFMGVSVYEKDPVTLANTPVPPVTTALSENESPLNSLDEIWPDADSWSPSANPNVKTKTPEEAETKVAMPVIDAVPYGERDPEPLRFKPTPLIMSTVPLKENEIGTVVVVAADADAASAIVNRSFIVAPSPGLPIAR